MAAPLCQHRNAYTSIGGTDKAAISALALIGYNHKRLTKSQKVMALHVRNLLLSTDNKVPAQSPPTASCLPGQTSPKPARLRIRAE